MTNKIIYEIVDKVNRDQLIDYIDRGGFVHCVGMEEKIAYLNLLRAIGFSIGFSYSNRDLIPYEYFGRGIFYPEAIHGWPRPDDLVGREILGFCDLLTLNNNEIIQFAMDDIYQVEMKV